VKAREFVRWFVTAAWLALAIAPAASAAPLSASFGVASHYPTRALLVSAPAGHPLASGSIHVTENGILVSGVSLTPLATANQGDFGVILLIDTSPSMTGEPIKQAMIAARSLAAQRTGQQEFGVITFDHSASVVLPLTTDSRRISAALASTPRIGPGTHIYDATLLAIQELRNSGVAAATVVVLSDGADRGSQASLKSVAAAASANHVRVYTVGVTDRYFTPQTLRTLARVTNGNYAASSAAGLRKVFIQLESLLTDRYVVRYRSTQGLGRHIQVKLSADGIAGTWIGTYSSPPKPPALTRVRPPAAHSAKASFWTSSLAVVLVALGSAVLLVGGALLHLVPRSRQDDLRLRIEEFTQAKTKPAITDPARVGALSENIEHGLSRFVWWPRFKQELDIAAIDKSAPDVVLSRAPGSVRTLD
jgi:von Willebrand factor type A domain